MRTLLCHNALAVGQQIVVDHEAHHGLHVLRLKVGDDLRLCDGQGAWAQARVSSSTRHEIHCQVDEVHKEQPTAAHKLSILVAAPKGSRFEDMVRSLTELGVGRIRVLLTERSQQRVKLERAQRVAAEALKQCGRSYLPDISEVVEFSTVHFDAGVHSLLDPAGEAFVAGPVSEQELIIGPEGGLSPQEREHLISKGVKLVCLAPHVLRIETAAVAAAAVWTAAWESI